VGEPEEEGGSAYEELKRYPADDAVNGWRVETVRGDDGALFTRIRIVDGDAALAELVDGLEGLTDFGVGDEVYKAELDQTERPQGPPNEWVFRAYAR
jgi:hypothetical protein